MRTAFVFCPRGLERQARKTQLPKRPGTTWALLALPSEASVRADAPGGATASDIRA